jgi:hypothetical protein
MTALSKYARLEAVGLWRPNPDAQRKEVFVSLGEATLVISDLRSNTALTHWSLAALERQGASLPAIFSPDGDSGETLELGEDAQEVIDAIETLRQAVARARPHPGRLRWLGAGLSTAAVIAAVTLWLPGALREHAISVLPEIKRQQISSALLAEVTTVTGQPCRTQASERARQTLAQRTRVKEVVVVPKGLAAPLILPDRTVLISHDLLAEHEDPFVAAGFVLAAQSGVDENAMLQDVLQLAGLRGTATLLTTGSLPETVLVDYVQSARFAQASDVSKADLIPLFEEAGLHLTPYAHALEASQDKIADLVAADPMADTQPESLMPDADWLRLQAICG